MTYVKMKEKGEMKFYPPTPLNILVEKSLSFPHQLFQVPHCWIQILVYSIDITTWCLQNFRH